MAQLHHTVDPEGAMQQLRERMARIPNVVTDPAPQVRPSCRNEHYWQVYFDSNRAIRGTFSAAGYPAPEQLVMVHGGADLRGR